MRIRLAAIAALAILACTAFRAEAIFRAYVASTGNDANPCTLQAPCRLLPAAIAAADDGGEVWILDSANYNGGPVTIAKSVAILAVPGAIGSVVASGGDAIVVNGSNIKVSLRNLVIRNFNLGQSGVVFANGLQLAIEECQFVGLPLHGIHAPGGNSKLVVRNSSIRDSGSTGIYLEFAINATIDNVKVLNAGTGIRVAGVSKATITNTVVGHTATGILVESVSGLASEATVERSSIHDATSYGLHARGATGGGSRANLVLRSSSVSRTDVGVFVNAEQASVTAFATLEGNVLSHNRVGAEASGPGTTVLNTIGNNTFAFNSQADVNGATALLPPK